jgi:peroxiredoxin
VLKAQSRAPEFSVTAANDGRSLKLSELRGRHVVLFFFPKAFTGG